MLETDAAERSRSRYGTTGRQMGAPSSMVGVYWIAFAAVVILILTPVGMVVYGSLFNQRGDFVGLANYVKAFSANSWSLWLNTAVISFFSSALALIMGLTFAWLVTRTNMPARGLVETLGIIPNFLSPFLVAMGWVLLASPRTGLLNLWLMPLFGLAEAPLNIYSKAGIIWVIALSNTPYVFLFTVGAFRNIDPSLEEAARVLGASMPRVLARVTLPLLVPAIFAGFIAVFVTALDSFGIPSILGTPVGISVFTTKIYQAMSLWPGDYGLSAALSSVLMSTTLLLIYIREYRILGRGSEYVTVTGRGYRRATVDLGKWRYPALVLCIVYLIFAAVLPYGVLFLASLLPYWNPANLSVSNLSFAQYARILERPLYVRSILNSLASGVGAATVVVLGSALIAFLSQRTMLPGRKLLQYVLSIPLGVPSIVLSIGILWTAVRAPDFLYGTLFVIVVALAIKFIPFGINTVTSTFVQIHPELEEAARVTGASWTVAFRRILFPLLRPGVIAAWLLVFVLAVRELSTVVLLAGPGVPLLMPVMYGQWNDGSFNLTAAMGISLSVLVFIVTLAVRLLMMRRDPARG